MLFNGPLDAVPLWALLAGTVAITAGAIEVGYRLGRWRRTKIEDETEALLGAIVAATLALLGFIVAFTFSLAATWAAARREIVVTEANTLGTTYLRAGLIPDGRGATIRRLLREYVDERLEVIETRDVDRLLERSAELHRELWNEAEAAGREHPDSIAVGLFINSLNESIDTHSRRVLVSLQNRPAIPIWASLYAATILTMTGVGYQQGLSRSRRTPAIAVRVLTFSVILALIADLDRPQDGWLRTSQQAIVELRKSMSPPL